MLTIRMLLAAGLLLGLTACGLTIPSDPEGTLDRVSGGTLRVGVTANQDWVRLDDGQEPRGIEPELLMDFADTLDAAIMWVPGSERELADGLEHGELDIAIGGFADDTPWVSQAGVTQPYGESLDRQANDGRHSNAGKKLRPHRPARGTVPGPAQGSEI